MMNKIFYITIPSFLWLFCFFSFINILSVDSSYPENLTNVKKSEFTEGFSEKYSKYNDLSDEAKKYFESGGKYEETGKKIEGVHGVWEKAKKFDQIIVNLNSNNSAGKIDLIKKKKALLIETFCGKTLKKIKKVSLNWKNNNVSFVPGKIEILLDYESRQILREKWGGIITELEFQELSDANITPNYEKKSENIYNKAKEYYKKNIKDRNKAEPDPWLENLSIVVDNSNLDSHKRAIERVFKYVNFLLADKSTFCVKPAITFFSGCGGSGALRSGVLTGINPDITNALEKLESLIKNASNREFSVVQNTEKLTYKPPNTSPEPQKHDFFYIKLAKLWNITWSSKEDEERSIDKLKSLLEKIDNSSGSFNEALRWIAKNSKGIGSRAFISPIARALVINKIKKPVVNDFEILKNQEKELKTELLKGSGDRGVWLGIEWDIEVEENKKRVNDIAKNLFTLYIKNPVSLPDGMFDVLQRFQARDPKITGELSKSKNKIGSLADDKKRQYVTYLIGFGDVLWAKSFWDNIDNKKFDDAVNLAWIAVIAKKTKSKAILGNITKILKEIKKINSQFASEDSKEIILKFLLRRSLYY